MKTSKRRAGPFPLVIAGYLETASEQLSMCSELITTHSKIYARKKRMLVTAKKLKDLSGEILDLTYGLPAPSFDEQKSKIKGVERSLIAEPTAPASRRRGGGA